MSFNSQLNFDIHYAKKHSTTNQDGAMICFKCDKPISDKLRLLLTHIRVEHNSVELIKCDQCDKVYDLDWKLKYHVKMDHPTDECQCKFCDKKFKSKKAYEKHLWRMHDEGSGPIFTCEHCGKTFKNNSTMWNHRQSAHGKATFHCDKCGDTFKLEKQLKNHLARKHSSGNFVCDQCGKTYTNPLSLRDHKSEVHTRNNPVKCTYEGCAEMFQNSSRMKQHIRRVHVGIPKKHKCDYCEKSFQTPSDKKLHEKHVHLGIKDVKCDLCDFKTFSKEQLRAHTKRVHGNEEYFCDYPGCTKSYGIRENMYAHKKRVHKVHWTEKFD